MVQFYNRSAEVCNHTITAELSKYIIKFNNSYTFKSWSLAQPGNPNVNESHVDGSCSGVYR